MEESSGKTTDRDSNCLFQSVGTLLVEKDQYKVHINKIEFSTTFLPICFIGSRITSRITSIS
jgi:hypothetical protein